MTATSPVPTNAEIIDEREATALFLVAIAGSETFDEDADRDLMHHVGSWRDERGWTWTRTTGQFLDGQTCDGWHVRNADFHVSEFGEFVEFISAS